MERSEPSTDQTAEPSAPRSRAGRLIMRIGVGVLILAASLFLSLAMLGPAGPVLVVVVGIPVVMICVGAFSGSAKPGLSVDPRLAAPGRLVSNDAAEAGLLARMACAALAPGLVAGIALAIHWSERSFITMLITVPIASAVVSTSVSRLASGPSSRRGLLGGSAGCLLFLVYFILGFGGCMTAFPPRWN